ncbi:MAG: endopeptidase La [Saccharofermentanales bacterium]
MTNNGSKKGTAGNRKIIKRYRKLATGSENASETELDALDHLHSIPMVLLKDLNVYPGISVSFDVVRDSSVVAVRAASQGSGLLFVVNGNADVNPEGIMYDIPEVGCIVKIRQSIELPSGNGYKVVAEGVARGMVVRYLQKTPFYLVEAVIPEPGTGFYEDEILEAHRRTLLKAVEIYGSVSGNVTAEMIATLWNIPSLSLLVDTVASNLHLHEAERQKILETIDVLDRSEYVKRHLEKETEIGFIEKSLMEKVRIAIDKGQKEYFLREQIKVIQEELGDKTGTAEEIERYHEMLAGLRCGTETAAKLRKEIQRLSIQPSGSPEGAQIKNYLDTVFDLPWGKITEDRLSVAQARKILNRDHYGMEKVKERILEFLAVRKLKSDSGITDIKGPILCLVGPPGVGKTSIARSLAQALGRKYVRMSLGGVRDEAEIRGHRRTYIGSMPGRFIQAMKQAGTDNPLILLDEIDKLGSDYRGDPSSALLEVLDTEQNHTFRDHYLEIPYNLSRVLFITTANNWETIPQALADRMEMVFLSGYTEEEKVEIAVKHIVGKTVKENALKKSEIIFTRAGVRDIIRFYTRESGVRELERQIAKVCRKAAIRIAEGASARTVVSPESLELFLGKKLYRHDTAFDKDQIGVATGLAWTPSGGDTLAIEVELMAGTGKIELTGQLGDVMRESAKIAISYVRSHGNEFGIDGNFDGKTDIHVHVPAGAIPKDGPSAGITLATALVSSVTHRPVDHRVAMTGELTLRGRVLPIGGLKEKLIAAVRAGISKVIIPAENKIDPSGD